MNEYMTRRLALKNGQVQPVKKEPKPIAKKSEKKIQQEKDARPQKDIQEEWYADKVAKNTGVCMECGGSTKSNIYVYEKATVAHVLPKRNTMFPSVATHPDNSIELCVTNGCHDRYDRSWEDAAKMQVWPVAVEKFIKILPFIAQSERRNVPDVLWQEVEPT